MKTLEYVDS